MSITDSKGRIISLVFVVIVVSLVCFSTIADESICRQAKSILDEKQAGDFSERTVDSLVALGEACIPVLYKRVLTGKPYHTELEALVRIGSPTSKEAMLECLELYYCDEKSSYSVSIPCIRAIMRLHVKAAEPLLLNIISSAFGVFDPKSKKLALALDSAAALMVTGSTDAKSTAQEFTITIMRKVPMGIEDLARDSLLVALSQLKTSEALEKITAILSTQEFIGADVFRFLPRESRYRPLVEALYERVQDRGLEWAFTPYSDFAAFEALSEMDIADDIVPLNFWQECWDRRKGSWVLEGYYLPAVENVTEDLLTNRMKLFIRRCNLKL